MRSSIIAFGLALTFATGGVVGAQPAEAAACTVSGVTMTSAYNVNCSYAQHWYSKDGHFSYAPRVSPGIWSLQTKLSPSKPIVGVNRGVLVNYR